MEPILIKNFITKEEAEILIKSADGKLVLGGLASSDENSKYDEERRNNLNYFISKDNEYSEADQKIREKLADLCGFNSNQFEKTAIVKYETGHFFKEHPDYYDPNDVEYYETVMNTGGNRIHTFIICLQEAKKGGGTRFPMLDLTFDLKVGDVLHWKNIENGHLLQSSMHEGLVVEEGEKWLAVVWVRQFEFGKKP